MMQKNNKKRNILMIQVIARIKEDNKEKIKIGTQIKIKKVKNKILEQIKEKINGNTIKRKEIKQGKKGKMNEHDYININLLML